MNKSKQIKPDKMAKTAKKKKVKTNMKKIFVMYLEIIL